MAQQGDNKRGPREFRHYRRAVQVVFLFCCLYLALVILFSVTFETCRARQTARAPIPEGSDQGVRCALAIERLDRELREEVSQWLSQPARRRRGESALAWEGWYSRWAEKHEDLGERCNFHDGDDSPEASPHAMLSRAHELLGELGLTYSQVLRLSLEDQQERLESLDALMQRAFRAARKQQKAR